MRARQMPLPDCSPRVPPAARSSAPAAARPPQGVGQTPSPLPLTASVRERGSSVTPAFEGWYYDKDGGTRLLVGYFNRNTKQEFDIPVGPNNRIEPGGPDMGQPTHFGAGRGWGVFSIGVPKDFGGKKLTWTIVANGFTNTITLHTQAPTTSSSRTRTRRTRTRRRSSASRRTATIFTGPPKVIAEKYTATVGKPLAISVWVSDEGPKINIPETTGAAAWPRHGCR